MDVSDYRKQYAAELEQAAEQRTSFRDLLAESGSPAGRRMAFEASARPGTEDDVAAAESGDDDDVAAALGVLGDDDQDVDLRLAALGVISIEIGHRPDVIDRLVDLFRDETAPAALRHEALSVFQQSSFSMAAFPAKRPDYLNALRSIVDDRDAELRRRAIGILAREKDEYVQRRLLEGLEQPSKALVPPAKAIQFLGYDVHAEYFPLLRRIAGQTRNRTVKKEAVRLLAADPSSREMLADLLNDKAESRDVRIISAIALQSLAPNQFEAQARRIVLDDEDDDQVRATCINALTHFANPAAFAQDDAFARRVEQMRKESGSPQLRRATTSYMSKYGA